MARTTLEKWDRVNIPDDMFVHPDSIRVDVWRLIHAIIEHVEAKTNG